MGHRVFYAYYTDYTRIGQFDLIRYRNSIDYKSMEGTLVHLP